MDKAKGASSGRTLASYQRSARKAARARGIPHIQQGDLGEAAFIYKAVSLGFVVAKPHGNMHRDDFIVDGGNGLSRVQVKACARLFDGFYKVRICCSKYGAPVCYTASEIDFVVAYIVPEGTWYVVPVREVVARKSLQFRPKEFSGLHHYAHYREAWHLLREPDGLRFGRGHGLPHPPHEVENTGSAEEV
jgi:PD-(D/E)XK endonuclease